jgi:hypothetical protein
MKRAVVLLLAAFACAGATADDAYWRDAQILRDGVRIKKLSLVKPRLMKAWIARVDLTTPGIGFVTTERAKRWGEPMPDYTNKVLLVCTKREKTADFLTRKRAEGQKVALAVNTAPWRPWCAPWTHAWANPMRWVVSGGVEVCAGPTPGKGALFVIWKDGRCEITSRVAPDRRGDVAHVHPGFQIIATNGVRGVLGSPDSLHPRLAFGLSTDKRFLYLLAVDGRQPKWSLGANLGDLCDLLLAAGAADVLNMDGGGSTSLVVFDEKTGRPRLLNRHKRGAQRPVALNLGITFD